MKEEEQHNEEGRAAGNRGNTVKKLIISATISRLKAKGEENAERLVTQPPLTNNYSPRQKSLRNPPARFCIFYHFLPTPRWRVISPSGRGTCLSRFSPLPPPSSLLVFTVQKFRISHHFDCKYNRSVVRVDFRSSQFLWIALLEGGRKHTYVNLFKFMHLLTSCDGKEEKINLRRDSKESIILMIMMIV